MVTVMHGLVQMQPLSKSERQHNGAKLMNVALGISEMCLWLMLLICARLKYDSMMYHYKNLGECLVILLSKKQCVHYNKNPNLRM
jgi:hypothetical protein